MSKHILIVSAVFPPEPVVSARLSFDIYHSIKKQGADTKVFHPKASRPNGYQFDISGTVDENEIVPNTFVYPQSSLFGRFRESYSFGKATSRYIKQHHSEIEAIYANTWPLFGQLFLAKAAKKHGIPYFIHIQDIYPESYCYKMPKIIGSVMSLFLMPIDKYVLRNAKGVIAISPSMISYLSESRNVDISRFTLVRNWQDDQSYYNAYTPIESQTGVCHIMYLGSINPTANVTQIINAVSGLDPSRFHLSIIGDGPDRGNCQGLARDLKLDITFGSVTSDKVAQKQGEADVLVLCLKKGVAKTATPSKLTAYMYSGRPIIASVDLDSDCANIIRESGCGIVVEPENVGALAQAMQTLANKSIEELNDMGKSGFKYADEHLSKQKNLNNITEILLKGTNND